MEIGINNLDYGWRPRGHADVLGQVICYLFGLFNYLVRQSNQLTRRRRALEFHVPTDARSSFHVEAGVAKVDRLCEKKDVTSRWVSKRWFCHQKVLSHFIYFRQSQMNGPECLFGRRHTCHLPALQAVTRVPNVAIEEATSGELDSTKSFRSTPRLKFFGSVASAKILPFPICKLVSTSNETKKAQVMQSVSWRKH